MRFAFVVAACMLAVPMSGCLGGVFGGAVQPLDYITDAKYDTWIIEIDHIQGHGPSSSATSLLRTRLAEIVDKTDIRIVVSDAIPDGRASWSQSAIASLESQYKDHTTGGKAVVTWVAYLDGELAENGDALGVTFGYDRIAMFDERIDSAAFLTISSTDVERAVLVHEFGHALGLVNRGLEMVQAHEDPRHTGHSSNEDSVMYWAVETVDVARVLSGDIPNRFDGNDKADVCAAGGKC